MPTASTNSRSELRDAEEDAVSPSQRLPEELWAVIFTLSLPKYWELAAVGRRRLYLAQVCRYWRRVAFAMPSLWTNIRIRDGRTSRRDHEESAMIELERTRRAPLHLDLNIAHIAPGMGMWNIWTWLCAQTHRWESASLEVPALDASILPLVGRTFPVLQSLGLMQHCDYTCGCCCAMPLSLFQAAPQLSEVSICWDRYDVSHPDLVLLSPPTLVSIDLELIDIGHTPHDLVPLKAVLGVVWTHKDTLRRCRILSLDRIEFLPYADAVFPKLETLFLENDASTLLHFISAPNLTTLTLDDVDEPHIPGNATLSQSALYRLNVLLDHSNDCPHLRTLSLICVMLDLGLFLACLRRLPSLTELEIISSDFLNRQELGLSVIHALVRDPATPASLAFLPRLASLTLASDYKSMVVFRCAFAAAVRSRTIPMTFEGQPLVCLTSCHSVPSWLHGEEGEITEEGEIDITMERVRKGYGLADPEADDPALLQELEEWRRQREE